MDVTVRLLATYRRYLPELKDGWGGYLQTMPPGSRVQDLMDLLPIPRQDAFAYFVNGRHAAPDQELSCGDVVSVFPAVGGG
jgi:molybdopterin converting factor small subunit